LHGLDTEKNWEICREGMAIARWPGRWDVRRLGDRTWIFDGTLNGCGLPFLRRNWEHFCGDRAVQPAVVTATLGRRRAEVLLPYLASIAGELCLVELEEDRALSGEELCRLIPSHFRGKVMVIPEKNLCQLPYLLSLTSVLVTGSIHLCGKTLASLH
jgi:folylpolyglutamate synthase/dihydropteroate synthase